LKICFIRPVALPPGKARQEKAPPLVAAPDRHGSRLGMVPLHGKEELHAATIRHARISRCTPWKQCSLRKTFSHRSSGTRLAACSLGAAKMVALHLAPSLRTSSAVRQWDKR
jgi:hypothetical protein